MWDPVVEKLTGNLFKSNAAENTDGSLTLRVQTTSGYQDVALGRKDGEAFRLGFLWTTENTAEIYVDGLRIAIVENVTVSTGASPGNDACVLNYCVPETTGSVQVSGLTITNVKYAPLQLTRDELLPGVNTDAVTENLSLPTSYTDPNGHLGTLQLS